MFVVENTLQQKSHIVIAMHSQYEGGNVGLRFKWHTLYINIVDL